MSGDCPNHPGATKLLEGKTEHQLGLRFNPNLQIKTAPIESKGWIIMRPLNFKTDVSDIILCSFLWFEPPLFRLSMVVFALSKELFHILDTRYTFSPSAY